MLKLLVNLTAASFRYPRSVLLGLLVIVVLAGVWGQERFTLNSDTGDVLTPRASDVWYQDDLAFKSAFPQLLQTAIVVLSGPEADAVAAAQAALMTSLPEDIFTSVQVAGADPALTDALIYYLPDTDFRALTRGASQLNTLDQRLANKPALAGVIDIAFGMDLLGDRRGLKPLIESMSAARLDQTQSLVTNYSGVLQGVDDRYYSVIRVKAAQQFGKQLPGSEVVANVRQWIAPTISEYASVDIALTGDLVLADEELHDALGGMQRAGAISLLALVIVLSWGVRSWRVTMGMLLLVLAGGVITNAAALAVVGQYNTLSLAFLVMFFGLGVDFGLHYGLAVMEQAGAERAADRAMSKTGRALSLCALTTAWAFLSFSPTEYRGLGELGVISALGMAVALLLTATFMPAWFGWVGLPTRHHSNVHASWVLPTSGKIVWMWLLLAGILLPLASQTRFDFSVAGMRNTDTPAMQALTRLQEANIGTDYSISVLSPVAAAPTMRAQLEALASVASVRDLGDILPDEVSALARLEKLKPLADKLYQASQVRPGLDANTIRDAVARAQRLPGLFPPLAEELSALALLTDEALIRVEQRWVNQLLMMREQLASFMDADIPTKASLLPETIADFQTADGQWRLEVLPKQTLYSTTALTQFVGDVTAVAPNAAGRAMIEYGVGQVVVRAFKEAVAIAAAGIAVLLMLYYRALLLPLLILLPLGVATLITFAVMAILDVPLNMANILVVPLILGLGIDTAIHVAHRYRVLGSMAALMQSSTPRAIVLSALTTVVTFASLMISEHPGTASIGALLAVAIPIMVVVTFSLLPALIEMAQRQCWLKPLQQGEG